MKKLLNVLIATVLVAHLTGCGTAQKNVHYQVDTPTDNLLQSYPVAAPPMVSSAYSILSFEQKEKILTMYIQDLLLTIGNHDADKAGLRLWKSDLIEKTNKLNTTDKK